MIQRIRRKGYRWAKSLRQAAGLARIDRPRVLLVVGCQRSGTTMLMDAFDRDWRAKVFYEWNRSVFAPSLRLLPQEDVRRALDANASRLVVAKPLLDSQHTTKLLAQYPEAIAIWIYRHYAAVAHSNLEWFGVHNGRKDIDPIIEGRAGDWKAEDLSPDVASTIRHLFGPTSTDHDAAALFWYARNRLFFDQQLDAHPRVLLCSYEEIAAQPEAAFQRMYAAAGVAYPGPRVVRDVREGHASTRPSSQISHDVAAICSELWDRLEQTRTARKAE